MNYFIHTISLSFFILTNYGAIAQNKKFSISLNAGQFINNPVSGRSTTHDFYGTYSVRQTSHFSPQLGLNLELEVNDRFRTGLQLHYVSSVKSDRKVNETYPFPSDSTVHELGKGHTFGLDFNFKGFFYVKNKINIYVNGSSGLLIARETISYPASVQRPYLATKLWFVCHLGLGVQYALNDNYGFFSEIDYRRLGPPRGLQLVVGLFYKF